METWQAGWFPSTQRKPSRQIFPSWLKAGSVWRLLASVPHHLPQEVSGSRWEVMELCGSVGGDMTSCQPLMQANIWRLWATSFLACWQGPLAWSQKPPPRARTRASETGSRRANAEWQHFHCEERRSNGVAALRALYRTSVKCIRLKITAWMCSNGTELWRAAKWETWCGSGWYSRIK